jgi:hypothetical protein
MQRSAYVYAILVDGVVRYIGKGRNGCIRTYCPALLSATRLQRSALLRSPDQGWRLVNEACIVDLFDKKVRHVGARDEAGAFDRAQSYARSSKPLASAASCRRTDHRRS